MKFQAITKGTVSDDLYDALKKMGRQTDGKEMEDILEMCRSWFEYGEQLTVEIDTEAKTIRVVEVNRK
jgi:hypothetical protein